MSRRDSRGSRRNRNQGSDNPSAPPLDPMAGDQPERKSEQLPSGEEISEEDIEEEAVEFLDDDLLVVEATGEVYVGEIGGEDEEDEEDSMEKTAVASLQSVQSRSIDEDLDDNFLSGPEEDLDVTNPNIARQVLAVGDSLHHHPGPDDAMPEGSMASGTGNIEKEVSGGTTLDGMVGPDASFIDEGYQTEQVGEDVEVLEEMPPKATDDEQFSSQEESQADEGAGLSSGDDSPRQQPSTPENTAANQPGPEAVSAPASDWDLDRNAFGQQAHKLALKERWDALAKLTEEALEKAPWAREGSARSALLSDLGRIYRDRLANPKGAAKIFAALMALDPASREATEFLSRYYEKNADWQALYDLMLASAKATWDPAERLERTRRASEMALERLGAADLAVEAWEALWQMGAKSPEVRLALTKLYRTSGQWSKLAAFLQEDAQNLEPAERRLQTRQVVETSIYGAGDLDQASQLLDEILADLPSDPLALLARSEVMARRQDWNGLYGLIDKVRDVLASDSLLSLMRMAAAGLWQGGRHDDATVLYRQILAMNPEDEAAAAAVEKALGEAGRHEELLDVMEGRLDAISDTDTKLTILAKMAKIADEAMAAPDKALEYWRRCSQIRESHLEAWQAMADLLERLERWTELTEVLNKQLDLRRDPSGRRDVLARLGRTFAYHLEDDVAAENCWRDVLVLDSSDEEARRELMEIFLRRQEFDALDRAYVREIAMTRDVEKALDLSRRAARNLEENIKDPARSLEAWLRVLDLAPDDEQALDACAKALTALGDSDRASLFMERRASAMEDTGRQAQILLEAATSLAETAPLKAKAIYERSLRLEPTIQAALGLSEVWRTEGHQQWIVTLADFMLHKLSSDADKGLFVRSVCQKLDDGTAKYRLLRQIASVEDDALLDDIEKLAVETDEIEDFIALLDELALRSTNEVPFKLRASRICADQINDSQRAVALVQETMIHPSEDGRARSALERIAEETKNYEPVMALLGAAVRLAESQERALDAMKEQARLAAEKMAQGRRAMALCGRILRLAPSDEETWNFARAIAEQHDLWKDLAAIIGSVLALVDDHRAVELVRERHDIALGKMDDREMAFHQLVLMARISPKSKLEEVVSKAAQKLDQWSCWLPLLETAHWQATEERAQAMVAVADTYEKRLAERHRAQDLVAFAMEFFPGEEGLLERLDKLAEATDRWDQMVDSIRLAAARSEPQQAVVMLKKAAGIAQTHDTANRSVEVHQRIVSIDPGNLESIDACIDEVRRIGDREALQHRLQQWIDNAPEGSDKVSKYIELAELAMEHAQPEKALLAYAQVLELEPGNETAKQAMDSMSDRLSQEQRLRLLRLEMDRVEGQRAMEVALEIATLQVEILEDRAGAIATLRSLPPELLSDEGHARLLQLLEKEERWGDLADVLEQRADVTESEKDRLSLLERALSVRIDHLGDAVSERVETLCRKILGISRDDERTFVLLSYNLRSQGRYQELAEQLESVAATARNPMRRYWALSELGRIYRRGLTDLDEAEHAYKLLADTELGSRTALLSLASLAADRGAWDKYVLWREKEASQYPDNIASLVFCHLAEICDVHLQRHTDVLKYYRKARMLDESNSLAKNALKALGRRIKNWREQAALAPGSDGKDPRADSETLLQKAQSIREPEEREEWLWKAVVLWPDNVAAWDKLVSIPRERFDWPNYAKAQWNAFQAFERATSPGDRLAEEVGRLHECADAMRRAGREEMTSSLEHRAYELDPTDARAGLAVGDERFAAENYKGAAKLYADLLERGDLDSLEPERLADLNYKLGECLLRLGEPNQAMEAFSRAVDTRPLHSGALVGLGNELMDVNRFAEAGRTYLRALVAEERTAVQASVYSRLGRLFEGSLGRFDEAGACYRRALEAGAEDLDTLWRALRHLKTDGRATEAEELATRMLRLVEDPGDLASLWVIRGQIAMAKEGMEEQATEAFDMALSYDPESLEALEGLSQVLERKGEWNQLLEILEALEQLAGPEKRAKILLRMADIARDKFEDEERREAYLRMAADIAPTKEVLAELEALYRDRDDRRDALKDVLAKLVVVGPPYFEPIVRLGETLLAEGKRRQAWVLLSPLAEVRKVDRELKSRLREMRKEYDKSPVPSLSEDILARLVRHPDQVAAVTSALALLEEARPVETPRVESFSGASQVGARTGLGRVLIEVSGSLGIEQAAAWRAENLPASMVIAAPVDGAPQIVLEAEFARRLVQNEVRFLFGYAMELSRPGHRLLATGDETMHVDVFAALQAVVNDDEVSGRAAELKEILDAREDLDRDALAYLATIEPEQAARRYWSSVQATARRIGLCMAGELHLALRALERLSGSKTSLQVDNIPELDNRLDGHPEWADMLAWAAGKGLAELLGD